MIITLRPLLSNQIMLLIVVCRSIGRRCLRFPMTMERREGIQRAFSMETTDSLAPFVGARSNLVASIIWGEGDCWNIYLVLSPPTQAWYPPYPAYCLGTLEPNCQATDKTVKCQVCFIILEQSHSLKPSFAYTLTLSFSLVGLLVSHPQSHTMFVGLSISVFLCSLLQCFTRSNRLNPIATVYVNVSSLLTGKVLSPVNVDVSPIPSAPSLVPFYVICVFLDFQENVVVVVVLPPFQLENPHLRHTISPLIYLVQQLLLLIKSYRSHSDWMWMYI